jgi:hypothetical protein
VESKRFAGFPVKEADGCDDLAALEKRVARFVAAKCQPFFDSQPTGA